MELLTKFPKIRNTTFAIVPLSMLGWKNWLYLPEEMKEPGTVEKLTNFFTMANEILVSLLNVKEWIAHFDIHVLNGTNQLLTWTYEFLSGYVLMTPTFLFSDQWFTKASIIFGVVGILLTILLTVLEGIKSTMNSGIEGLGIKSKITDTNKILKRLPIVIAISGFTPIIFEKSFDFINKLSLRMVHAGELYVNPSRFHEHVNQFNAGTFDVIALLGFDVAILTFLIPLVLQTARRWFDILALGAITPLAATCWIFDEHRGYFDKWWSSVKKISFMQLYYSFFITIMGMIAVGVQETTTSTTLFVKILVIVGGLYRLINPPSELKSHLDSGGNVVDMYRDIKNVVTLKSIRGKSKPDDRSILRKHREARVKREKLRRKLVGKLFKK